MFYDSGFTRLSCGGELLFCLLLAFTLCTNASLMTSLIYHFTQMAVNEQCAVCNLHTGCKMMCTICRNWTHSRCCYVTYDNFAMCLPCNHNCFPFSEISNIELLDLFPSTTKITPITFNEISFSLAEPHVPNDYLTPSEINSANSIFCNTSISMYAV